MEHLHCHPSGTIPHSTTSFHSPNHTHVIPRLSSTSLLCIKPIRQTSEGWEEQENIYYQPHTIDPPFYRNATERKLMDMPPCVPSCISVALTCTSWEQVRFDRPCVGEWNVFSPPFVTPFALRKSPYPTQVRPSRKKKRNSAWSGSSC